MANKKITAVLISIFLLLSSMAQATNQSVKGENNKSLSERLLEYLTPKIAAAAIAGAVTVLYMGHRYMVRAQNQAAPDAPNLQHMVREAAAIAAAGLGVNHAANAPVQELPHDVEAQDPALGTPASVDALLVRHQTQVAPLIENVPAPRFDPHLRTQLEEIAIHFVRHFTIDGAQFDTRIFRERLLRRFPALILEFLDRAHEPLAEARIRALYQRDPHLDAILGAPVILFAQNHLDYESVANNYALTFQLFTPDTRILIETYLPHEELELLPLVLGQLAFIEHLLEHPHLQFRSPESRELRGLYVAAARAFLLTCLQRNVRVPFADIRARGWDSQSLNDGERNRGLRRVITLARLQSPRVFVHIGAAHAPAFSINRVAARLVGPAGYLESPILTTGFLREAFTPEMLRMPVFDEVLSIVELQESLPFGHVELLPQSLETTMPHPASTRQTPATAPNERPRCEFCKQPADKQCSGCKKVHYCNRDCQSKDWKAHKPHCNPPSRK